MHLAYPVVSLGLFYVWVLDVKFKATEL